ncbi:hypothetical protein K491DRAFT_698887 [Lophiostoma macrostomum CBS 122681]|uniref:Uncharacterized protein n=1 Tax=Lophiostoma macrostomum CBS 122681 TaxID=1314788 RepID=A0A6A6SLW1_9PLEO|nr:hypothetical protein K491DRAFT_698887 [Lophiostoma macrostomum CBS 122681]
MENRASPKSPTTKCYTWPLRGDRRKWEAQWKADCEAEQTVERILEEQKLPEHPSRCIGNIRPSRRDSAIEPASRIATFKFNGNDTLTFSLLRPTSPDKLPFAYRLRRTWRMARHPKTLHQLLASIHQIACPLPLSHGQRITPYNFLAADPSGIDFLLICMRAVDWDMANDLHPHSARKKLLLDCPIPTSTLKTLIDKMPALSMPLPRSPPASTIVSPDICPETKHMLAWLLASPFNCLTSITLSTNPALQMPHTVSLGLVPFLVTTQPRHKEALFAYHAARFASPRQSEYVDEYGETLGPHRQYLRPRTPAPPQDVREEEACRTAPEPFPVYHGTCPSRLPSILSTGLKVMSRTPYQRHGRLQGSGIYLCTDPTNSLRYSSDASTFPTSEFNALPLHLSRVHARGDSASALNTDTDRAGQPAPAPNKVQVPPRSWGRDVEATGTSKIRILLVCELAGHERSSREGENVYVVKDEDMVVVRLVLVLPQRAMWLRRAHEESWGRVKEEVEGVIRAWRAVRLGW